MNKSLHNPYLKKIIDNLEKNSTNYSVKFIIERIDFKNYRAHNFVNHNRITIKKIETFLEELNKYNEILVPKGDSGKNKYDIRNYSEFEEFCKNFKKRNFQGTENSIKKNLAPDFDRYGFIERILKDKNGNIILENDIKKRIITNNRQIYWSITKLGKKFLESSRIDKESIFKDVTLNLHKEIVDVTYTILKNVEKITYFEFMMFVNIPDEKIKQNWILKSIKLIKEFRKLSRSQKENIELNLKNDNIKIQKKSINKKYRFDFSNWKNGTMQLVDTLKKATIFQFDDSFIFYNVIFFKNKLIKKRIASIKKDYLKTHKVIKKYAYDFHHIVPIYKAENEEQFILIDHKNNLLHIEAGEHAKLTRSKHLFIKIKEITQNFIKLQSVNSNEIFKLDIKKVNFSFSKKNDLIIHNQKILNSLSYTQKK